MGNVVTQLSRPLRDERADAANATKFSHDFTLSAGVETGAAEEAETIGLRESQQDAMFVGVVSAEAAINTPATFLQTTIAAIVGKHATCQNGTTLCTTIARKVDQDVELTIGNLGDSRAALVIRHKDGTYESILLTEDHDLDVPRVKAHLEDKGGTIHDERIINITTGTGLNMGASVGDKAVGDCLLTTPDIWTYKLSQFLRADETIADISASLVSSCDGLWDITNDLKFDKRATLESGQAIPKIIEAGGALGNRLGKEDSYDFNLARLKQQFDSSGGLVQNGKKFDNFADALVCLAAFPGASTDNISVAHVPLVTRGKIEIESDEPIMATICDGHGENLAGVDHTRDIENWDGGLVASSVACDLFRAADIKEIGGLEIQESQEFLYKMLKKTPTPKKAAPKPSSPEPDTDDFDVPTTFDIPIPPHADAGIVRDAADSSPLAPNLNASASASVTAPLAPTPTTSLPAPAATQSVHAQKPQAVVPPETPAATKPSPPIQTTLPPAATKAPARSQVPGHGLGGAATVRQPTSARAAVRAQPSNPASGSATAPRPATVAPQLPPPLAGASAALATTPIRPHQLLFAMPLSHNQNPL